jgi:hypothetical protein
MCPTPGRSTTASSRPSSRRSSRSGSASRFFGAPQDERRVALEVLVLEEKRKNTFSAATVRVRRPTAGRGSASAARKARRSGGRTATRSEEAGQCVLHGSLVRSGRGRYSRERHGSPAQACYRKPRIAGLSIPPHDDASPEHPPRRTPRDRRFSRSDPSLCRIHLVDCRDGSYRRACLLRWVPERREILRDAALGGAVARFDHVDHVAGMLGRDG